MEGFMTRTELIARVKDINGIYNWASGKSLDELGANSAGTLTGMSTDNLQAIIDKYGAAADAAQAARSEYEKSNPMPTEKSLRGMGVEEVAKYPEVLKQWENKAQDSAFAAFNNTKVGVEEGTINPTGGTVTPQTPSTIGQNMYGTYMGGISEPWQETYKAPTATELALATKQLEGLGFTKAQAQKMAAEELGKSATEMAKSDFEVSKQEMTIQDFLNNLPQMNKEMYGDLNKQLGDYQTEYFNKKINPAITESMAARGLTGGALDTALAQTAGDLSANREATLAPLMTQSGLAAQQAQYENALRLAQTAGMNQQQLKSYGQQMNAANQAQLYNTAVQNTQNAFTNQQANQNYMNQRNLMDYQNQLNNQNAYSTGMGQLLGLGARTILGGGLGALVGSAGGLGFGKGATMGFTGQVSPNWWK